MNVAPAHLCDARVGALDVAGGLVHPAAGVRGQRWAVLLHGAPALATAPAALELPVRAQTHAAAVPLGTALVQVHCGGKTTMELGQLKPNSIFI